MNCLVQSRFVRKLSFLDSSSHQLVINYLEVLEARHCAEGTLEATIGAFKRFLLYVPPNRQLLIKSDLAQTTARDFDCFIANTQKKGLAPSTINNTISIVKDFFAYVIENEQMLRQPVNRRRHHLFTPTTLPKPMAEKDLIEFFKVIDSVRDRLLFLLMLRCGLRTTETCSLKWQDIDQLQQTLRVNNGKGEVDRIAYLSPDATTLAESLENTKLQVRLSVSEPKSSFKSHYTQGSLSFDDEISATGRNYTPVFSALFASYFCYSAS